VLMPYKAAVGLIVIAIGAGALAGSSGPEIASAQPVAAAQPTTPPPTTTTTPPPTTTTTQLPPPPPPPPPPPATTTPPPPRPTTTTTRPRPTTTTPKPRPKPAPGTPCNETARACVDLSANQSWLLDHGRVIYGPVPITHGRTGWRTPAGTFRVQFKDIDHKSSLFDNAPMPYSVFFNGGIAFHAGSLSVQSHGCIHLSTTAAKTYYNTLRVGDIVQVVP
jgi:lipoprotein-anchoring transpeptidase ErfK/SrfK